MLFWYSIIFSYHQKIFLIWSFSLSEIFFPHRSTDRLKIYLKRCDASRSLQMTCLLLVTCLFLSAQLLHLQREPPPQPCQCAQSRWRLNSRNSVRAAVLTLVTHNGKWEQVSHRRSFCTSFSWLVNLSIVDKGKQIMLYNLLPSIMPNCIFICSQWLIEAFVQTNAICVSIIWSL